MDFKNQQFDPMREWHRIKSNPKPAIFTVAGIVLFILLIWMVMSVYYTVEANEEAIILRFGKCVGTESAGLHFKLPFGIDTILKAQVNEKKRQEFGFRTAQAGVQTIYRPETKALKDESRILTGDLNILMVKWVVRYQIKDIKHYFFNIRNPEETIRDVSESIMRMVIGDSSVDEVLTIGRSRIMSEVKLGMQGKLDEYKAGIQIIGVQLKEVTPPEEVKTAFDAVNKARQQQEKIINEAQKQRNSKIPEAKGKKLKVIEEAHGYAEKRINEASGNVYRFLKLSELFRSAPEVTLHRIYLETMERILPGIQQKIVVDGRQGSLLKLLNLNDIAPGKGR